MPSTSSETYGEWLKRTTAAKLTAFYLDALTTEHEQADYPEASFQQTPIYKASRSKSLPPLIGQIALAVQRHRSDDFKKLMGPAVIPLRILHAQATQHRFYQWLKAQRALLHYRRAEQLFWTIQKEYFFRIRLNKIELYEKRHKQIVPSERGNFSVQKYLQTLVPACYTPEFRPDIYAAHMQDPQHFEIKHYLDQIVNLKISKKIVKPEFRKKATLSTHNTLIASVERDGTRISNDLVTMLLSNVHATPKLLSLYHHYLQHPGLDEQAQLVHWFKTHCHSNADIASVADQFEKSHILPCYQRCDLLTLQQENATDSLIDAEEELELDCYDDSIKASGIAELCLDDARFQIVDKTTHTKVPLLHFALRAYTEAIDDNDIKQAYDIVKLCFERGASPFQPAVVIDMKTGNSKHISALHYANYELPWELLATVLTYTLTKTYFAEELRKCLLNYVEEKLSTQQSLQRLLERKKSSETSLHFVRCLTEILHIADQYADDLLLVMIERIKAQATSRLTNNKLRAALEMLIAAKDDGLFCQPLVKKAEMEMQPLSPFLESKEAPPKEFFLRANGLFSSAKPRSAIVTAELMLDEEVEAACDDFESKEDPALDLEKEELEFNQQRFRSH